MAKNERGARGDRDGRSFGNLSPVVPVGPGQPQVITQGGAPVAAPPVTPARVVTHQAGGVGSDIYGMGTAIAAPREGAMPPGGYWGEFGSQMMLNSVVNPIFNGYLGATRQWLYTTPVFDLRPDLGMTGGVRPNAKNIDAEVQRGPNFWLVLRLQGILPFIFLAPGMRMFTVEGSSPFDPTRMAWTNSPIDITADVAAGSQANVGTNVGIASLTWVPESKVRFWQVAVILEADDAVIIPAFPVPTITIDGALH